MPNHADNSPHIFFPLPEVPPATSMTNVLPDHLFKQVQDKLESLDWGPGSSDRYHSITSRWCQNVFFPKEIDDALLSVARDKFQDPEIELSFYFTCRYQMHEGNIPYLWEHMDQNGTQHNLDLCVVKKGLDDWGLIVDGQLFSEEENKGIFMSSCQQSHSRPPYPSRDPDAYMIILFAIYHKKDHWWASLDGTEESFLEAIEKYRWDGDIRYAEYAGHAPYFNDLPEGNKVCTAYGDKECDECWVIPEDLLAEKMRHNRELNESRK